MARNILVLAAVTAATFFIVVSSRGAPARATFPGANGERGPTSPPPTSTATPHTVGFTVIVLDDETGEGLPYWRLNFYQGPGCDPSNFVTSIGTDGQGRFSLYTGGTLSIQEKLKEWWINVTPLCQDVTVDGQDQVTVTFRNRRVSTPTPTLTPTPTITATPGPPPNAHGKIAFERAAIDLAFSEIYITDADRTAEARITRGHDPAWSPDGSKFAFAEDGRILVANADGSHANQIIDNQSGHAINGPFYDNAHPTWSSDGSKIAFESDRNSSIRFSGYDIYVADANGTDQTQLTQFGRSGYALVPSWSPDGSKIAYIGWPGQGNAHVYVMNSDGSGEVSLTSGSGRPAWSPDGSKIAYASILGGNVQIYVMNADGSVQVNLTNSAANDFDPSWSPDGSHIAFVSDRDGNREIYVMQADGSDQARLTVNPESDTEPDWQPQPAGDVNCQGGANSIDALLILQFTSGLLPALSCQDRADVNRDGRIDSIDAALILQYSARLVHYLPV